MDFKLDVNISNNEPHIFGVDTNRKMHTKLLNYDFRDFLKIPFNFLKSSSQKRDLDFVSGIYDGIYDLSNEDWSQLQNQRRLKIFYKDKVYDADGWYLRNIHNLLILNVIRKLGAKSILEIGSGRGNNLLALSRSEPSLEFVGLEYSKNGVDNSRRLFENPPEEIVKDFPRHNNSSKADQHVNFIKDNAFSMSFSDDSFDLSFTILVLEQMPHQYYKALLEMRRVTRKYCVFIEPFAEANNLMGKAHLKKMDYFRFSFRDFLDFGLEPVLFFTDYPQKVKFQTGLLVTKVMS